MIVDSRRGLLEGDQDFLGWAETPLNVHVLLTKADKLNRSESTKTFRETQAAWGTVPRSNCFRYLPRRGSSDAQRRLLGTLLEDWPSSDGPSGA